MARISRHSPVAFFLALLLACFGSAPPSAADDLPEGGPPSFVLEAPGGWSPAEDLAVAAAGGTVLYRHAGSGLAIATSASPRFVRDLRSKGIKAQPDMTVQWRPAMPTSEVVLEDEAVTPGDETFINTQWNYLAVEAPGAWAAGYTGLGVRVAVVDGGLTASHIELDANVDVAHSRSFVPGFNFDQDSDPPASGTPRTWRGSSRPRTTRAARSASPRTRPSSASRCWTAARAPSVRSSRESSTPPIPSPRAGPAPRSST